MKIVAIVQARMGSTRLPNKVMMKINGVPMIELLFNRLSKSININQVVLATSNNENNIEIEDLSAVPTNLEEIFLKMMKENASNN